jgi:hypothetical protein
MRRPTYAELKSSSVNFEDETQVLNEKLESILVIASSDEDEEADDDRKSSGARVRRPLPLSGGSGRGRNSLTSPTPPQCR